MDGRGARFSQNLQVYTFSGHPLSEDYSGYVYCVLVSVMDVELSRWCFSIGSYLWHGSSKDGRSTDLNCKDWFSSERSDKGRASKAAEYKLLQQWKRPCSNSYNVLCISVHSGDS